MFNLIIATSNKHKMFEIRPLFRNRPVALKSLADFDRIPQIIENGDTFAANAAIKARAVFEYFSVPVLADDSGLEVPALDNAPGIHSARYAGEHANHEKNNLLLLKNMEGFAGQERQARFVCTLCYKDALREKFFTGISDGYILESLAGRGGFGYDPLFFFPQMNKTFAQLTPEEKNRHSHRGRALQKFLKWLDRQNFLE